MPVEARISPIWKKQKLFIAIFCLAISAWFFYDGVAGWPASNERWLAHDGFVTKKKLDEWPAYARGHGWVEQPPEKLYGSGDIIGQYVIAGLAFSIGILILTYWFTQRVRVLRMDEEAVYTASGTRVPFEAVTAVNRKKWETKGIARVRYTLEGRTREFVVDDYKFDTDPTRQILEEIEKRLTARKASDAGIPPTKTE
jgi:hypothetical protein